MTELAIAAGGYGEILPSPCFHGGASDWLVRWRRGLGDRFDLGFDGEIDAAGSNEGTVKFAARYQLTPGLRLEAGVGASDGGIGGRSVNGDVAAVIGTRREDRTWNYYGSLRLAASRGCANLFCASGSDTGHNPGAILPLVVGGATARICDKARFVMEGSPFGGIISREHPGFGYYVHISVGVLFEVGKRP